MQDFTRLALTIRNKCNKEGNYQMPCTKLPLV